MLARAKTVEKRVAHVVAAFSAREQSGCLMKAEEEARLSHSIQIKRRK